MRCWTKQLYYFSRRKEGPCHPVACLAEDRTHKKGRTCKKRTKGQNQQLQRRFHTYEVLFKAGKQSLSLSCELLWFYIPPSAKILSLGVPTPSPCCWVLTIIQQGISEPDHFTIPGTGKWVTLLNTELLDMKATSHGRNYQSKKQNSCMLLWEKQLHLNTFQSIIRLQTKAQICPRPN